MTITSPAWRALAWGVFAAFTVHNVEEALAMPAYAERMAGRLPLPDPRLFQLAIVVVTVVGLILVALGVRRDRPDLPRVLAWIMLINVLVPHVPAAIHSGGYAPGIVTSLLLNLPVNVAFLWVTRRPRPADVQPTA